MIKNIRSILLWIFVILSVLMILLSSLSLIDGISFWFIKILDFPRLQYLILSCVLLLFILLLKRKWSLAYGILVVGLLSSIVIHSVKIGPYLLGEKVVPDADNVKNRNSSVRIMIANVLMTNKNSESLLKLIDQYRPDVLLAMEVDEWWVEQLNLLEENFPHKMEYPLDNAYGLLLYSRLPLTNSEIKFLKHSDVPSFHTTMTLPSGQEFGFHGIHPVAPFPSAEYPDNVGKKEVALHKVGLIVAEEELPSIVAGDFNDVSWSKTTRFFEDRGDLNNVRLGRGLFNSFNANSYIMRWPLDHFFVTKEFRVVRLERLGRFGSDHFPLLAEFYLKD